MNRFATLVASATRRRALWVLAALSTAIVTIPNTATAGGNPDGDFFGRYTGRAVIMRERGINCDNRFPVNWYVQNTNDSDAKLLDYGQRTIVIEYNYFSDLWKGQSFFRWGVRTHTIDYFPGTDSLSGTVTNRGNRFMCKWRVFANFAGV